jgi:hypothetical protein
MHLSRFLSIFNKETDRGAALTGAAYLEERLGDILKGYLIKCQASEDLLDGFNAPLGTFSSKVAAAAALGLIEPTEFEEIQIVRRIRNEFAHRWEGVSFEKGRVRDLASRLPWRGPAEFEADASARSRFNSAVALLNVDLMWRTRLVVRKRLAVRSWPDRNRS